MERIPEPELMDEWEQSHAYANADFSAPHDRFVELFVERFPDLLTQSIRVLDIGCGPADVTIRFARVVTHATVTGIDGAEAMLQLGRDALRRHSLTARVVLQRIFLPHDELPPGPFDAVISNAFLHHLGDPQVLWNAVRASAITGSAVFVVDLFRPDTLADARRIVDENATSEPEILQRDFFNSLCAAFSVDEVHEQLKRAGLEELQISTVSDRHFAVWGTLAKQL